MKKVYKNQLFSLILLVAFLTVRADDPVVVHLVPPKLTSATLSEEIVCTRPMRDGCFNISVENVVGKTITHCYGHGGSGWTTLFGSVARAIELFLQTNPDKSIPIRVIGSGCMGLTMAIELNRLGYHVAGIYTKDLYNIPSWRATGYFALVSVKTSPEEQKTLDAIGMNTFRVYQMIDRGQHPYITKEAVNFMPVYCSLCTESGVEALEASGMIPAKELVTLDFGNGVVHPGYVKYMTYFMNTTTLMRQLIAEVERRGIPIDLHEVASFGDVSEDVIFDCAGLGGRSLNHDTLMIPVRGHLVTLNAESGTGHMEYMIYTKVKQDGRDAYIYMFPKNVSVTPEHPEGVDCQSVLGGTFIPHVDQLPIVDQKKLDRDEFDRMLDRNSFFFYGVPFNTSSSVQGANA